MLIAFFPEEPDLAVALPPYLASAQRPIPSPPPFESIAAPARYSGVLDIVVFTRRYSVAGYTPPKPAEKRARRNKDPRATVVLAFEHGVQPELPDVVDWHPQTVVWWEMWGRSAMAELFTESDWVFLAETALYHHALWNGNLTVGPELRLRVQKFGMTPEDRARLRIVFADADDKDAKRGTGGHQPKGSAYGNLRAVPKPS